MFLDELVWREIPFFVYYNLPDVFWVYKHSYTVFEIKKNEVHLWDGMILFTFSICFNLSCDLELEDKYKSIYVKFPRPQVYKDEQKTIFLLNFTQRFCHIHLSRRA